MHTCLSDMLLTQPVERDEAEMPSPAQLKRKIIIKVCLGIIHLYNIKSQCFVFSLITLLKVKLQKCLLSFSILLIGYFSRLLGPLFKFLEFINMKNKNFQLDNLLRI